MKIRKDWIIVAAVGAGTLLSACGSGDGDGPGREGQGPGAVRGVNGTPDSSGFNVTILRSPPPQPQPQPPTGPDGSTPLPPPSPPPSESSLMPVTIDASGIPFGGASRANSIPGGYYTFRTALSTGGPTSSADYVPIIESTLSTVFSYGNIADGSAGNFIVQQVYDVALSAQQVSLQLVHAAYATSQNNYTLCLRLQVPNQSQVPLPLIAANFAAATGPFTFTRSTAVASGTYRLQLLPCSQNSDGSYSSTGNAFFDSGPKGVALPQAGSGHVFQIAVLDASPSQQSQYGAPVSVLLLDDTGAATPLFQNQN